MIVNMKEQRIINLNHLNILEIVGKGASELLQGQLTCDLEKVKNRSFELGAICNTKGRVINSFILCKAPSKELDSYWLICNKNMINRTKEVLNKYSPFYEVQIEELNHVNFYGVSSDAIKKEFGGGILENNEFYSSEGKHIFSYLQKSLCLVLVDESIDILEEENTMDLDLSAWHLDNINSKEVEINLDNSELFTPHELNFDVNKRIDFEKGCYTGQEIIARMHYRAKTLPRLRLVKSNSALPNLNTKVLSKSQKPVGSIISALMFEQELLILISIKATEEDILLENSSEILEFID